MRLTKWSQDLGNVEKFLAHAKELGAGPRAKLMYAVDADGHPCFYVELPEKAAEALDRKQRPRTPSKAKQAVEKQLTARKEAVKVGNPVSGYVPPVARNGKVILRVKKKRTS
jgi:hypothetical protein